MLDGGMTFGWDGIAAKPCGVHLEDVQESPIEGCVGLGHKWPAAGRLLIESKRAESLGRCWSVCMSSFQFCWRLQLISKMDNLKSILVSLPLMTRNCRREQSEDTRGVIKLAWQCVFLTEFPNWRRRSNETTMMYRCQMGVFPCPLWGRTC